MRCGERCWRTLSNPVQQLYDYLRAKSESAGRDWKPASEVRFRPSEIGGCAREIYYRLAGNKPRDIPPETLLLFEDGDLHHDAVRHLMQEAGIELQDLVFHKDGKVEETGSARRTIDVEFGNKVYPVTISGRTDGSVRVDENMVLLELKSVNKNKYEGLQRVFQKYGEAGVIKTLQDEAKDKEIKRQAKHYHRRFWYQFQSTLLVTNQAMMYVVLKNRDNAQIGLVAEDGTRHGLMVEADEEVQATILRRCAMVLRALEKEEPPQAEFMDGSMSCSMCAFYHLCWGANKREES